MGEWRLLRGRTFDLGSLSRHRLVLYGFAALWIVVYHMAVRIPERILFGIPAMIQDHGMCGVEIFLMLSGFGLYAALSRNPDVGRFYRRRLTRVFLPAFIVAAVYCAVQYMSFAEYLYAVTIISYFFTSYSFWYVAFIMVMYAVYPLIFRLQNRSATAAWMVCGVVSLAALALPEIFGWPDHIQRAVTRVPVFLLGCMIAPYVLEGKRIPVWSIGVTAAAFVVFELIWKFVFPDSYSWRAVTFILLSIVIIAALAYLAGLATRCGAGRAVYRCFAFTGSLSLEIYLVFARILELLLKIDGYEEPTGLDLLKTDISAFILTILLSYLLAIFTTRLVRDFSGIQVPQEKTH